MPQVSIVIVCMNRPDQLFPCLDGIRAHTRVDYETLVVAYLFSEENLQLLRERYPWVTVIPSSELRGFAENNNLALREARGRDCFIFNDDTLMTAPVIDPLLADMESLSPTVAAIQPCIRFADGRIQTCGRAPWTLGRYLKHYLHRVDETVPGRWSCKEGLFQSWTLNGACFLARTERFREAGWFDERYFFTPEDIALGHRFNEMGYTVWADAGVCITHLAGGTVSRSEPVIKPVRVRGAMLFYGTSAMRRAVLRAFIGAYEGLRVLKYRFADRSDPQGRNALMYRTAVNVLRTLRTKESPKDIYQRLASL